MSDDPSSSPTAGASARSQALADALASRRALQAREAIESEAGARIPGPVAPAEVMRQLGGGPLADPPVHASLLDALPYGVLAVDDRSRIAYANATAYTMFGFDEGELVGCDVRRIIPVERNVLRSSAPVELFARRKDWAFFAAHISFAGAGALTILDVRDVSPKLARKAAWTDVAADRKGRMQEVSEDLGAAIESLRRTAEALAAASIGAQASPESTRWLIEDSKNARRLLDELHKVAGDPEGGIP